jgi:predicted phosphodiesterase
VRFLIISDLHANLEALESVLADASGQYERVICCGDLVGYNPDPAAVVEWSEKHCDAIVRGNHDKVIAGIDDLDWFNPVAQTSARWTQKQLTAGQLDYLHKLPRGPLALDGFEIIHGAPFDEDEYVISPDIAAESFSSLERPIAFFGHSHLQGGYFEKRRHLGQISRMRMDEQELTLELEPDTAYLINPGSVGQPRDGDPRAAYVIYDKDLRLVQFRRVGYPIELTSEKIRLAGLPDVLGLRLFQGQ